MSKNEAIISVIKWNTHFKALPMRKEWETPEFWKKNTPINFTSLQLQNPNKFSFEIDDEFRLDNTGLINHRYKTEGTAEIAEIIQEDETNIALKILIHTQTPPSICIGTIKARYEMGKGLKFGVFIYRLEVDLSTTPTISRSMVEYAIRYYLRKTIQGE